MRISPKDLVRLIVEADKQGYNQAIKHSDLAYDEYAADFRKALDEERTKTEQAFDRGFKAAQADYQAGLSQGLRDALSDEALASAKSQAYEAGYQRALEEVRAQGEGKTLELMAEARESERQKIEAAQPKLMVWFMPLGSVPALGYPPGIDKIQAIKAIRWAYGSGEGYGLKEAKDLVEIEPGTLVSCGEPLPQARAVELYLLLQAAGFEVVLRKP